MNTRIWKRSTIGALCVPIQQGPRLQKQHVQQQQQQHVVGIVEAADVTSNHHVKGLAFFVGVLISVPIYHSGNILGTCLAAL
eukprot:3675896-Amphidinium_carterae.2